ncbi:hypothetical protein J2Z40_000894 [Cytobacillus eiseniae]|uniref:Lipoprotein n=1 Tax=Cytobacillus eiseniae TaxID=762947 RepID=A0ABS4RBQ8_9BACI|nr:hypothetical protein [Cytobacillus eiseniae]MBP2240339.1 hypothetical protein [Cytobacillus eiseniae]
MYKKIYLFFIIGFLLLIIGCDPSAKTVNDLYEQTPSTNLENENLNGIKIGATEDKIIDVFGLPQKTEEVGNPKVKHLIYKNEEVVFMLDAKDKLVKYFIAKQPEIQTSKNISTGDNKTDVINSYGNNFYEREEGGTKLIGYIDKKNNLYIEFGLSEEKILLFIIVKQYE